MEPRAETSELQTRTMRKAFHDLVTGGETVLTTELGGWVQRMTDAMREQQDQQSEAASKVEPERDDRRPPDPPHG